MKTAGTLATLAFLIAVNGPAAAEPLRLEVTYGNPDTGPAFNCFGFGAAGVPPEVVGRFHFDSSSLPTDDVNSVVVLHSLTAARLAFGDASWTLPGLQSFVLGVSSSGAVLFSLEYEFAALDTTTTSGAVASDSGFQLQITGTSGADACAVLYTSATAQIVADVASPVEKTYTHHAIAPLGLAVKELAGTGVLRTGEVKDLRNRLGLAYRDLSVGDPGKALKQLALYETSVEQLNATGRLSTDVYTSLTSGLSSLTLQSADLGTAQYAIETPELPSCRIAAACSNRVLAVDAGAFVPPGLMDGSAQFPFTTITGALEYAADQGWSCVDVQLLQGLYAEGIIPITRDTRLAAANGADVASALQNLGDHFLSVDGIVFADSGVGAPAALEIRATAACTVVQNATFAEIQGNAISQEGGALTLRNARVTSTRSRLQDTGSGRAVRLTGGVDACLSDVVLNANRDGALLIDGPGTRVYATRLDAHQNRTVSVDQSAAGAIVAINDALLLGEVVHLDGNELLGIGAFAGGRAHFRQTKVAGTRAAADSDIDAASNAGAYDSGQLQLSSFTLENSHAGLYVRSAHATLADGFVQDHYIGAALEEVPADFPVNSCFTHNVNWTENEIGLDSELVEVPVPAQDLDSLSQPLPGDPYLVPAECISIAFNPAWCAAD